MEESTEAEDFFHQKKGYNEPSCLLFTANFSFDRTCRPLAKDTPSCGGGGGAVAGAGSKKCPEYSVLGHCLRKKENFKIIHYIFTQNYCIHGDCFACHFLIRFKTFARVGVRAGVIVNRNCS